jgi:prophage regulatory protein
MRPTSTSPAEPVTSSAQLHRMPGVMRLTGLGRSTIYRMMAEGSFPAAVRLSSRAVAWRESDLEAWSRARPPSNH